jgi:hypothetical protein
MYSNFKTNRGKKSIEYKITKLHLTNFLNHFLIIFIYISFFLPSGFFWISLEFVYSLPSFTFIIFFLSAFIHFSVYTYFVTMKFTRKFLRTWGRRLEIWQYVWLWIFILPGKCTPDPRITALIYSSLKDQCSVRWQSREFTMAITARSCGYHVSNWTL